MSGISIEISNERELRDVAEWLINKVGNYKVLAVEGEMGAGKTTFIKSLCQYMMVEDEVSSPTFSLVNEYLSSRYGSIFHFDFYRLEHEEEALSMGVEDYLYSGNYCFMEWPNKIKNLIPDDCVLLTIKVESGKRIFTLNVPNNG